MSFLARPQRRDFVPLADFSSGFSSNWSGEKVNESSALQVSAVMACVGLIADSCASLPIQTFRRTASRDVPLTTDRLFLEPSDSVTRYELVHQIVTSLALHGNAYVIAYRNNVGDAISLVPVHVSNVVVESDGRGGRRYLVGGKVLSSSDVLHLRYWTPPGALVGLSPIQEQKTTIGLALAMERHLAQFYGEGATPSSVLETDAEVTVEQAKVLQETWFNSHNRRRRPAVLAGGLKYRPVTASAADMELNQTRELQIAQVARIFRVPTYLIGAKGDSQTYSNSESAGQHFVQFTLMPWLRRVEDAFSTLLPRSQFVRFDVDAFLRANTLARLQAYQIAVMTGIRTPNECRAAEGLEPYKGGDEFVMALPGAPMAGPGTDLPPAGTDADPPR